MGKQRDERGQLNGTPETQIMQKKVEVTQVISNNEIIAALGKFTTGLPQAEEALKANPTKFLEAALKGPVNLRAYILEVHNPPWRDLEQFERQLDAWLNQNYMEIRKQIETMQETKRMAQTTSPASSQMSRTAMETTMRLMAFTLTRHFLADGKDQRTETREKEELKEKVGPDRYAEIEEKVGEMRADGASPDTIQVAVYDLISGAAMQKPVTAADSPLKGSKPKKV